jgi:hypothetical protein
MTAEEPDSISQIIEYNARAVQAMREQSAIDRHLEEERAQKHEENMQKVRCHIRKALSMLLLLALISQPHS